MINPMMEVERVAEGTGERAADGAVRRIVVTHRDIEILKFVHDYRLLRIEHLERLTGRTYTRVHRRLKGLFDTGYLLRIQAPQRKDIYRIGKPGLALLLGQGLIIDEDAARRRREHELKPATLDHEMMIADLHVMLELATREGPVKLVTWREGESAGDSFEVGGVSPQKIVIQPDAFFQLKDGRLPEGQNRRSFLLEADRSTEPIRPRAGSQRFRDKVERYRSFIEAGRAFDRYGVRSIRIVTIALTHARRDNLCSDTDAFLQENDAVRLCKFFLFGTLSDVSASNPGSVLDPLFRRPGNAESFPLFPSNVRR
jgi:hypothetical protein